MIMKKNKKIKKNFLYYIVTIIFFFMFLYIIFGNSVKQILNIDYLSFSKQLENGEISNIVMQPSGGVLKVNGNYKKYKNLKSINNLFIIDKLYLKTKEFSTIIIPTEKILSKIYNNANKFNVRVSIKIASNNQTWFSIIISFLPLLLFILFFYFLFNQQGGSNRIMTFGKSNIKNIDKSAKKIRFSDVAGVDEEKQELIEVVDFLKFPKKFLKLGARIPSGILLEGPPGTGKTLIAKAVAGEANVPFYSISGSSFVEMFVGVGASRVRDLFNVAKKNSPSIIFIDEIDAVGRQRGAGLGGGHDEREQTLNQLLVEMDGFEGNEGVIVIAATNRYDVLDPALLRPGRFDRRILIGMPDIKEREEILKIHSKNKPLDSKIELNKIAKQTPGFVGADLENMLNEAALVAARRNKIIIENEDINEAEDRVIAGPAKKSRIISKKERKIIAYHEAGHTIIGLVLNSARYVHKVTIIPRSRFGGYMIALPKEDKFLFTKNELLEQIIGLLGGRAAEEIKFNIQSSGSSNDFEHATSLVRKMITEYGMNKKLGLIQYENNNKIFMGRDYNKVKSYSEETSFEIDKEMSRIINNSYKKAKEIILNNINKHKLIAEKLLEYETLDSKTIENLFKFGKI